ncbi:hypothetical protein FRC07_010771 [Ceratobasidium sp. 392]|nr:hypothetical protein FRC07_010771 [Ceratobasidium sp. 392]
MAAVYTTPALPAAASVRFAPPLRARSSSSVQPPSVSFGDSRRPCVELHKPVWVIDDTASFATVTGEIEVDTSLFPRDSPFAIGLELKSSDTSVRSEWNHDGPNNRPSSFVQIGQRLAVGTFLPSPPASSANIYGLFLEYADETVYTTTTLTIPHSLLPASQHSQVFTLSCCAFLLSDPRVKTELSVAKFMVVRRAPATLVPTSPTSEVYANATGQNNQSSRTWTGRSGWGKILDLQK